MVHLRSMPRRRTMWCVALVLLLLAVFMAFATAQDEVPAAADAVTESVAHDSLTATAAGEAPAPEDLASAADEKAQAAAAAAEEAERQRAEAEEAERQRTEAEEAERQRAEAEEAERQRAEAEEAERQRAEAEEAERQRAEAEEAERQRAEAEEAERQRAEAEEAERQRAEAEEAERQRVKAEEAERQRKVAAVESQRKADEAERQRKADEAERQRKAAEEEKAKRTLDSVDMIRYTAKVLPQGCVKSVVEYLFRVHEYRNRIASAVRDARADLNEARVHAPDTVAQLETTLAQKQDDLLVYDTRTLRMYGGSVPRTCIAESQAWIERQPPVTSTNDYVQAYMHFYHLLAAHINTLYLTARGTAQYLIDSYTPVVGAYTQTAAGYYDRAQAIYTELRSTPGGLPDEPFPELAKRVATMLGYAAVPIGLGVAAGIIAVVALPPVVAAVIAYEYVYKIWVELFLAYYIYGVRMPDGAVSAVTTTVAAAQAGEWAAIGKSALESFLDLVVDADTVFYNGIIAIFLLGHIVVACAILICVWCRCCVPGMRSKRRAAPAKRTPTPAAATTTTTTTVNGGSRGGSTKKQKSDTAAAAAAAAPAAKKKN
ncbi:hypothetical protein NESM_000343100 [Novymonas esmeraldas]|uniref:Kinetoplast-associated protein-like protein n=1 Tax=Novymonas esmeraldas TaxID=1808958 RepID=A0AAW0EKX7_9TRYP